MPNIDKDCTQVAPKGEFKSEKELKPFLEYNDTEIMTNIYSWLSKNQVLFLEEYFNKCYHQGRKQALEDVRKLIDEIEKNHWDCNLPCGVVNSNDDKCKVCGKAKEESWDNEKLEELKRQINKLENASSTK